MTKRITLPRRPQGLHEITQEIQAVVREADVESGLCTIIVQHTSAGRLLKTILYTPTPPKGPMTCHRTSRPP